jgi:septum site-determining protein MinD
MMKHNEISDEIVDVDPHEIDDDILEKISDRIDSHEINYDILEKIEDRYQGDNAISTEIESESNDSRPRVIVMTSGKGGVGKTTSTANIGTAIARLGYTTALIDADIGLRNLDLLLGLENRVLFTAMEVFEGTCQLSQALIRDKNSPNLSLLAISKNRQRYNITSQNMRTLVDMLQERKFQFIIIDCPAGIDLGFVNAIAAAQEAIVVTTPEITAIRDADRVIGLLEANGINNIRLLVNRVRADMIQQNDMMSVQDVQEMLGLPLVGVIPEDRNVIISTNRGEPLVVQKNLSLSGIAYENAARRLIGIQELFIDLADPSLDWPNRIRRFFGG